MRVCLACYGDRVATLLETATSLRFYRTVPASAARDHPPDPLGGDSVLGLEQDKIVGLPHPLQEIGITGFLPVLKHADVEALLCGGLTCRDLDALGKAGVRVVPWISGAADDVAAAWFAGRIDALKMPGCGGCGAKHHSGRASYGRRISKRGRCMKTSIIAVSSMGPSLKDMVDPRFGRAAGFVVVDLLTNEAGYIDNAEARAMPQGAGIQAAEQVSKSGASLVISGFLGPKALQALSAAGVHVVQNVEGITVGQAVEKFRRGELSGTEPSNAHEKNREGGRRQAGG